MRNPGGAPKGGRVHWFTLVLPRLLHTHYEIKFKYATHHYRCTFKTARRERFDEYLIIRTSEKCYRVMYYDNPERIFEYKSFRSAPELIDYLLVMLPRKLDRERQFADELAARKGLKIK